MAFPADYFLPAKTGFTEAVTGDIRFFQTMFEQIDGIRLMCNERGSYVNNGLTISPYTEPFAINAAFINALRGNVEAAISGNHGTMHYINTVLNPSGDLNGTTSATAPTTWTKAAIFAALGIGVGGDWTRIPARNPFGLSASGGALVRGDLLYKEHINEMFQFLGMLTYISIPATRNNVAGRSGDSGAAGAVCATEKSQATASWNASSFSGSGTGDFRKYAYSPKSGIPGIFNMTLSSQRAKINTNLSFIPSGSAKLYLQLTYPPVLDGGPVTFGQTRPHAGAVDTYQEWTGASLIVGSDFTTGYVTESDTIPLFDSPTDTCPVDASQVGWLCNAAQTIALPTFTYPAS